jgi:hypothetical protein
MATPKPTGSKYSLANRDQLRLDIIKEAHYILQSTGWMFPPKFTHETGAWSPEIQALIDKLGSDNSPTVYTRAFGRLKIPFDLAFAAHQQGGTFPSAEAITAYIENQVLCLYNRSKEELLDELVALTEATGKFPTPATTWKEEVVLAAKKLNIKLVAGSVYTTLFGDAADFIPMFRKYYSDKRLAKGAVGHQKLEMDFETTDEIPPVLESVETTRPCGEVPNPAVHIKNPSAFAEIFPAPTDRVLETPAKLKLPLNRAVRNVLVNKDILMRYSSDPEVAYFIGLLDLVEAAIE